MERLVLHPVALDLAYGDPAENLKRVEAAVRKGLRLGKVPPEARLFVFPELTLTGFVTRKAKGIALDSPELQKLRDIAKENGVALVAGFPEANPKDPARPYNSTVFVRPDGELLAKYRKMHLFTWGDHPEADAYTAGERGRICEYRGWRIALSLCFDLRFPVLFQAYGANGTDLFLAPSCWVDGPKKAVQFRSLAAGHAVAFQAFFCALNRVGKDPYFSYDGARHVFSPFGEDLLKGATLELEPGVLAEARRLQVRAADRAMYQVAE